MNKPTIFLSHITEEAEIASAFKIQIEKSFLGMVDVFQSSDTNSLKVGQNWLNGITDALRNCEAIIVFCSPYSIQRPWINFECGAGWARDIQVVPICHSGLRPVDLPIPISLLQGVKGADAAELTSVFEMIAEKLGADNPQVDTSTLAQKVSIFSEQYVEETEIYSHLRAIRAVSDDLLKTLARVAPEQVVPIQNIPEQLVERCREPFEALQMRKHLSFNYAVVGMAFAASGSSGGGNFGVLQVQIDKKLAKAILVVLKEN